MTRKAKPVFPPNSVFVNDQEIKCQHQLLDKGGRCSHGYVWGTTCEGCIRQCPDCWDLYSSSPGYCPRPAHPKQGARLERTLSGMDLDREMRKILTNVTAETVLESTAAMVRLGFAGPASFQILLKCLENK
jgi:hypothetical protein